MLNHLLVQTTKRIEDRGSRIEDRGSRIVLCIMTRPSIFDPRSSILDPQPSQRLYQQDDLVGGRDLWPRVQGVVTHLFDAFQNADPAQDRKSTRLNSSHVRISYAVFCLK